MVLVSDIYQSRTDNEAAIILRQDPVVHPGPYEKGEFALSEHQLRSYRKNGFIQLRGLLPESETEDLLREARQLAASSGRRGLPEAVLEPGSEDVRSVFRVHGLSAVFERLMRDGRLLDVARQILGSEVYIHQSRVNLKPGFAGKEFYWHSDFETWHIEDGMPRMRALSCVVLLTENNEFNGPLMLVPGSHMQYISCVGQTPQDHYKQSLRKQDYGVPDPTSLGFLVQRGGLQSIKGAAGSVLFFDCNTMHGSNSNISPFPRANLFFVYNSIANRLGSPRGGLQPRPEFIACRDGVEPLQRL
ncbi:MAG: ectoine hydroxylase [Burkholderiales bacterium]|nr:ectoine hydroxylase [Burkholderiales bacterium]MDP2398979.1 ectoine hydroxylase [Burkholderiales bacterium]